MNPEIRRLKKEFDETLRDISPERMEEIFCKRAYESAKKLWLENDQDGYEKSERELVEFVKKMTPEQYHESLYGRLRAYNNLLYDLRCQLRSEGITFLSVMIAHNHLFGSMLDNLETYEALKDKYWYDQAKDLLERLNSTFKDGFGTPEVIDDMEAYLVKYEDVEDLTPRDLENLEVIRLYVKRQRTLEALK